MSDKISVQIKTMSNLFIGGASAPFEIGGIDQYTVTDQDHFPYIPASSLKGALAAIVREDTGELANKISGLYRTYLQELKKNNQRRIEMMVKEEEEKKRINDRYDKILGQENMSGYLFGIERYNNTPKLLFSDLLLEEKYRNLDHCFSIDFKNSLNTEGKKPEANPRSYKTARSGLVFSGSIRLHKIKDLGEGAEELCRAFIKENLQKFNDGIYRLGNSKSRGYGRVLVSVSED